MKTTALAVALLTLLITIAAKTDEYREARTQMIAEIENDVRQTSDWLDKNTLHGAVLAVMGKVPRHEFVPEQQRLQAYKNRPLPIGFGQTISQPYIVAIMTDLLDLQTGDVVFELGTGSGYQAAVLAELAGRVYSVEIVPELGERAAATLDRLAYANVEVRIGDGYYGWPEQAPFDAIIVTAAGDHIPPPLVQQLKPGGRMILPVGSAFLTQQLMLVEKQPDGGIITREVLPVRFVPLTGAH
jgi:protein-L-isoaspartate(D-aspartate) O-methyltransferase